jgi:hypothetical protein
MRSSRVVIGFVKPAEAMLSQEEPLFLSKAPVSVL